MNRQDRFLRAGVLAVVGLGLIPPIVLGLWETGRAAFGILPALGRDAWTFDPWRRLATLPGFGTSLRLTLVTGFGSTLLSLLLATGFCAAVHARVTPLAGARMLTPFLAIPHAAMAVGLAFVLAPSGWIARALAPLAGWSRPPELSLVNDGWGLALMIGLMVKELPFLLLVILSALSQIPVARQMAAGRALGYGRGIVWIKVIMPQVWPLIRLPVWVVLAYALSVVDMAIILGPSNPPTLAVAVTRWFTYPDPAMILPASAGAILQALVVVSGVALLWLGERAARRLGRWWLRLGGRGVSAEPGLWAASAGVLVLMALGALGMMALLVWSLAWRWSFPQLLPETWSLRGWAEGGWFRAMRMTLLLAGATVALSLVIAVAWLEGEDRARRTRAPWAEALIYLPLLIPQIGFLYGLNVIFLRAGLSGGTVAVIWAQALFVFPYVMIALSDPWRALDPRLVNAAAALGAGPWRRLWAVKLPILLRPILTAAAIGVAVSV
ncbi:MAG: ABC transporter permease subunit, partial [Paracoccaceae bacterium]|nr:ABC transporter permease subunit [Paracoccaceae bacterium]